MYYGISKRKTMFCGLAVLEKFAKLKGKKTLRCSFFGRASGLNWNFQVTVAVL